MLQLAAAIEFHIKTSQGNFALCNMVQSLEDLELLRLNRVP
jgi:hypothetical protein